VPGRTGTCVSALSPKGPRSRSCSPNVLPVMKWSAASERGIRCTLGGIAAVRQAPAATRVLLVSAGGWLARHDLGPGREPRLETARADTRGRLLALGAGLLATGALAIAARNIALSRQGRLTGRYAKAVEQLGSAELDVRIGSIHTLERVAREAPADHPAVMEILASFIREHSPPQWPPADPGGQVRERSLRPDVQAAMTVVGRRLAERDTGPVDLTRADLAGADLAGADLAGADLGGARLTGADLSGADLTGADLADTDLTGADLTGTDFTRAELTGALWPPGWPVPASWTRYAGCGQLIPAGAGAEKTAADQPHG
jgi:Pentapeptide repeats (8 copies)